MEYEYSGDAHRALYDSYHADEAPFPTDTSVEFPPQTFGRAEANLLKKLFFPRCWNAEGCLEDTESVRNCLSELGELICRGTRPYTDGDPAPVVRTVLDLFPAIRELLKQDVEAAYKGDPAAKSYLEIIRSYPSVRAMMFYRVAHLLYTEGAEEYARELTEFAKTITGIDIHPGAQIGEYVFIDHGTSVVIGETATVGDWVRLYQDVTLGALHFEEDEDDEHALKKGYKRHPDVGDHVVIGAGTKVLGPITVGDHVSIGANSWVTEDVPDHTEVYISNHPEQERKQRR